MREGGRERLGKSVYFTDYGLDDSVSPVALAHERMREREREREKRCMCV